MQITLDGDRWTVLSLGISERGLVVAHLASTTRFRQQANGRVPIQIVEWVNPSALED